MGQCVADLHAVIHLTAGGQSCRLISNGDLIAVSQKSLTTLAMMTLRQLRQIASDLGVSLYSRKSKEELVEAISSSQESAPIPPSRDPSATPSSGGHGSRDGPSPPDHR